MNSSHIALKSFIEYYIEIIHSFKAKPVLTSTLYKCWRTRHNILTVSPYFYPTILLKTLRILSLFHSVNHSVNHSLSDQIIHHPLRYTCSFTINHAIHNTSPAVNHVYIICTHVPVCFFIQSVNQVKRYVSDVTTEIIN